MEKYFHEKNNDFNNCSASESLKRVCPLLAMKGGPKKKGYQAS